MCNAQVSPRSKERVPSCRESDEEEVSGSDAGEELAADEIEASDDSEVIDVEAPSRKRKAPQTALKVGRPLCQGARGFCGLRCVTSAHTCTRIQAHSQGHLFDCELASRCSSCGH